uniref:Neprosin PEP catalytic domain-containing protein n=1 Tax=Oryza glumipatula TaxID=40148 RepID=A0A0E0A846_9ORYZ
MAAARTWSRRGLVALLLLAMIFPSLLSPSDATSTYLRRRQVLKRLNKPPLATIQSPDGDIIDCVHISRQPAFDHPLLKDHTIQMQPSSQPSGLYGEATRSFTQTWNQNGEKTNEEDVMRATSLTTFGKKTHDRSPHPHSHLAGVTSGHYYGVAYATGDANYYGTKVTINDPAGGNWWLQVQGNNVGYWPSSIFTLLQTGVADSVEWGGEVDSPQITTPMGSGHFPEEGFGKATYSRAIQVVDSSNNLKPPNGVGLIAPLPSCYNVMTGSSSTTSWGTYIYYGGPGCPQNSEIEVM